jgi:hypothetical protein
MKNLWRGLNVSFLMLVAASASAQSSQNIFDPNVPVIWLGLDFSKARFVGPAAEFGPPAKYQELLASWNVLMNKEQDKFNVKRFFKKKSVILNFDQTNKINAALNFASMMTEQSGDQPLLTKDDIQTIVNNYNLSGWGGLGLMFNIESFDFKKKKSTMWITLVNMNTNAVIFSERRVSDPSGAGPRNFWGNSVLNMMERINRKEWDAWMAGNYMLINSPLVATNQPAEQKVTEEKKNVKREVPLSNTTTPQNKTQAPVTSDNINEAKVSNVMAADKSIKPGGQYYALLIGVSKYHDNRLNLDNPVKDALKIKKVLTEQYSFLPENTIVLQDPTRGEIFSALYKLRNKITINDNLLIFYAGHGYWDEKIKQGYWWPSDANSEDPSNWLSNSDLREQLRGISSAHTLLVSDACFSGGLFRTRDPNIKQASIDYQMLYKMPSRRAITSGTLTAVPDNSVFTEYLLKRLTQNEEMFLPAQQLFNTMRLAIINNSATVPQEGVIAETGDEGGDFIFVKKGN